MYINSLTTVAIIPSYSIAIFFLLIRKVWKKVNQSRKLLVTYGRKTEVVPNLKHVKWFFLLKIEIVYIKFKGFNQC